MKTNLVFLHSHFQRGGVTSVVENQVAAWRNIQSTASDSTASDSPGGKPGHGQVVLISGGRVDGLSNETRSNTQSLTVPELEYDALTEVSAEGSDHASIFKRALTMAASIADGLSVLGVTPKNTILHWHNHSLGKNAAAPLAIRILQHEHGFAELLQIHDFAEDYRPENLNHLIHALSQVTDIPRNKILPKDLHQYLYRTSTKRNQPIGYATLTEADGELLQQIGVGQNGLWTLPNSVTIKEDKTGSPPTDVSDAARVKVLAAAGLPSDARWCVYPVRGIRRKNVGELLLLSHFLPPNMHVGLTLPPTTAIESKSYKRWQSVGRKYAPRVVFDAGIFEGIRYEDNLAASEFILSTSVAEGFGMAFLEPWLANRGVIARRLKNVVTDFVDAGMDLDRLYDAIWIPGSNEWLQQAFQEHQAAFQSAFAAFPNAFRPNIQHNETAWGRDTDCIDFACLTPKLQIEVIRQVSVDPGFASAIKDRNHKFVGWLDQPFHESQLQKNRQCIVDQFSLDAGGHRLQQVYENLLVANETNADRAACGNTRSIVDLICQQRAFYPCRTEVNIET